jgi:uracil-DNA glycosylase family 4
MTPWQLHCEYWGNGCGAPDCNKARRVVLGRGVIPCDLLFVGEAPGESEDCLGKPFVGPAGKLLNRIIDQALAQWQVEGTVGAGYNSVVWAFTNIVGCIPRNPENADKADQPLPEQIQQCEPRLQEFIEIAQPKVIIAVGKLSAQWIDPKETPLVEIIHPAAILRANVAHQDLLFRKAVLVIRKAVETYCGESLSGE